MPKEEKEKESEENKEEKPSLEEEIEKLKADVEHWKNEYYRAYADTKNLRSSLEKDHKDAIKYRAMGFIEDLLPILDSFQSALSNEPKDPALKAYLTGFQFIYRNFVNVLANEGVSEIAPHVEEEFNPATMSAVDTTEAEKENLITKVYGNGYKLHDRLIRPAMVQVSTKKVEKEDKNEQTDA